MSRIGNRKLSIPTGASASLEGNVLTVKGAKGELTLTCSSLVKVTVEENEIVVTKTVDTKESNIISGTTNANIKNILNNTDNRNY